MSPPVSTRPASLFLAGKPLVMSKIADIPLSADHFRYFAGWSDKIHGKTIPCDNIFGKVGDPAGRRCCTVAG